MAGGTISFGGVGSGIDTNSIVTGLVNASQGPLNAMQAKVTTNQAASTSLSQIGTLLGTLQTALEAVDEAKEVSSYSATSSSSALVVSTNGAALPGSYQISVDHLASEQRSYSNGQNSSTAALGASGSLNISVAGAAATSIALDGTDSLESIAAKINASGLRVSASVFNDGSQYRLQVSGLDTGDANTIAFSGTTLGLDVAGNTRQAAKNSQVTIDGFTVSRPTNQVTGAIVGVTLNLTDTTTTAANVKVATDPSGLATKLNAVASAYNAVVDAVHTAAGFGSTAAAVSSLAGDSLLRSLTERMSGAVGTVVGTGTYQTLGSIGVNLDMTGHMSVDSDKLTTALAKDPTAVANVIAGPTNGTGAADVLHDAMATFDDFGVGLLDDKEKALIQNTNDLNSRILTEQDRLNAYADSLRAQFTALDTASTGTSLDSTFLTDFFK